MGVGQVVIKSVLYVGNKSIVQEEIVHGLNSKAARRAARRIIKRAIRGLRKLQEESD